MNIQFLASLIKANNRLVIPSLGAFLHKDNGSIVFSPFLNKDDGMLQSAICRRFNVSAVQAQAEIDQFCQTVRTSLSTIGKFYIDAVGILVINENGGISLIEENVKPVAKEVQEPVNVQIPSIDPLLSQINRPQVSVPAGNSNTESSFEDVNSVPRPVTQPRVAPQPRPQNIPPRPVAAPRPQPSWVTPTVNNPVANPQNPVAQGAQPNRPPMQQNPQQRPQGNPQQRPMQPQGNQPRPMGQPQGNITGQPMGNPLANPLANPINPAGNHNQPQGQNRPRPAQGQNNAPRKNPNSKPKQGAPKGKNSVDIWLVVAIIAAILVVILIIYGLIYTDPTKQMF